MWTATVAIMTHIHTDVAIMRATREQNGEDAKMALNAVGHIQGVFFTGPPPKKLKYGKLRLGEVRCI